MTAAPVFMPLNRAYLCVGCEIICNSSIRCPLCGAQMGLLGLQAVLDRETSPDAANAAHAGGVCCAPAIPFPPSTK